jgi:hypothetical protein
MKQVRCLSVLLIVVCAILSLPAVGDTIYVSTCGDNTWSGAEQGCVGPDGPKATIQAGIDAALAGDTVVVLPGTYTGVGNRDIDFGGKEITVQGSDPNDPAIVAATIIDCQASGRGFYFHSGETDSSVLSGLTITNGIADEGGGIGVRGGVAGLTISKMKIVGNSATEYGGGIACTGGPGYTNLLLDNCIIAENTATLQGGGLYTYFFRLTVNNCTVVNNTAGYGGGIEYFTSGGLVRNSIVWGNSAEEGAQIGANSTVEYCDVEGGYEGTGNIDVDPLFVDEEGGDYHLSPGSECINAGDPSFSAGAGETDIDGDDRVVNGRVDIGADEFYSGEVLIGVSARVMEFHAEAGGPNPEAQILLISNSVSGTFNWMLSEGCDWFQAIPASGTCVNGGDPCEVTISLEVSGLEVGLHEGEIIVTSAEAANSPQTIMVLLSYGMELRYVPDEYNTIQSAIDASSDGDIVIVASGTYTGEGNRDLDFGGRAIMVRSTGPYDPDVVAATIIDGEGNAMDCADDLCERHRGFYFHNGEGPDAEVSGFTITNFCAPDVDYGGAGGPMPAGGGILCEYASPTISFCVIDSNWAHQWGEGIGGGGIHCEGGNPTIIGCTVSNNEGYFAAGGIDCDSATIIQCTITDNYSGWTAGGINCGDSTTIINDCIISNNGGWGGGVQGKVYMSNSTIIGNNSWYYGGGIKGFGVIDNCIIANNNVDTGYGGGIYGTDTNLHIINSIIIGNSAHSGDDGFGGWYDGKGGGIYCVGGNISNCTITGNRAEFSGGGVYGNATIINSILWDDDAPNGAELSGNPTISYSDVEGGWYGLGNINKDPLFADAPNGDVHLQSQAGRWDPASEIWVYDAVTSPCIDAGNPGSVLGEEGVDGNNVRVNMGAYGGTAEASKTPAGWGVLADLTNDGIVNTADYCGQAADWLKSAPEQPGDLNRDGEISFLDLSLFIEDWLIQAVWY